MDEKEYEMQNISLKKENPLNVFFYTEKENDFNELKQEINKDLNNIIKIIGQFNNLKILDEIYYYLGIKEKNDIVKSIRNVIILNISLEKSENLLKELKILEIKLKMINILFSFFLEKMRQILIKLN